MVRNWLTPKGVKVRNVATALGPPAHPKPTIGLNMASTAKWPSQGIKYLREVARNQLGQLPFPSLPQFDPFGPQWGATDPFGPQGDYSETIEWKKLWRDYRMVEAVPDTSPGQIAGFAQAYMRPQIELIMQGAMLRSPEPRVLGAIESRKRILKNAPQALKTRGFVKSYKRRLMQKMDILPSHELPFLYKTEMPSYVSRIPYIWGGRGMEVPEFNALPVRKKERMNALNGRDGRNGFLRSRLGRF